MSNFVFKQTEVKSMKLAGFVDTDNMVIEIDGAEKKLQNMIAPFNGCPVEINIKLKTEKDLGDPDGEND